MKRGNLYLIATPIGNLDDITKRAVETLKRMEIILAEDTRKTGKLLDHLGIKDKKLLSYYEGNQWERIPLAIKHLHQGKDVGLVTDAGSPLIADPGYQLVQSVLKQNINIIPLPGPSALITGLMGAGLPCDKFTFLGYPPKKSGKKLNFFKSAFNQDSLIKTFVFYESPNRLISTLELINNNFENVSVAIAREMTKQFEEFIRGGIAEVLEKISEKEIKGEVTVVVNLN
jgi:16S rRNA (cytidine1402-2'-O)-methyltransferase